MPGHGQKFVLVGGGHFAAWRFVAGQFNKANGDLKK